MFICLGTCRDGDFPSRPFLKRVKRPDRGMSFCGVPKMGIGARFCRNCTMCTAKCGFRGVHVEVDRSIFLYTDLAKIKLSRWDKTFRAEF